MQQDSPRGTIREMSRPVRRNPILRLLRLLLLAGFLALVACGAVNVWMSGRCASRIYRSAESVPAAPVGIVLGTGRLKASGTPNGHFEIRMDAAAALWKAGKVKKLILSGDNGSDPKNYNEPADMRDALVSRGVPETALALDGGGLRTRATMRQASEKFAVTECLIISDDWHLPRALWLAEVSGLKANGFAGRQLPWDVSWKGRLREWAARASAFAEVQLGME